VKRIPCGIPTQYREAGTTATIAQNPVTARDLRRERLEMLALALGLEQPEQAADRLLVLREVGQ